jgi:hypothetical protein
MNIFPALFGRKKVLHPAVKEPTGSDIYVARQLKSIRVSTSVEELRGHAGDYSGYVREAALARCVQLADAELLPVIASRLNDWVPQVRNSARSGLLTLMPLVPASALISILPAIARLLGTARTDHAEWVAQFEQSIIRLMPLDDLVNVVRGRDVKAARACYLLLKNHGLIDTESLIKLFLNSREDIILAIQVVRLCSELPLESRRTQFLAAMRSHFGAVRTIALRSLLALGTGAQKDEIAIAALLDVQSSVRSVAMTYLRTVEYNLHTYYRAMLLRPELSAKSSQVALTSLASLRSADDIALVKSFVRASLPTVRVAALTAWLKLDVNDKDAVAAAALIDEAQSVRKFALKAVRHHGAFVSFKQMREVLIGYDDMYLLMQFSERSKWEWLESIARVSVKGIADKTVELNLAASLRIWICHLGNFYERPDIEQIIFLSSRSAVHALSKLLGNDASLVDRLELELEKGRHAVKLIVSILPERR